MMERLPKILPTEQGLMGYPVRSRASGAAVVSKASKSSLGSYGSWGLAGSFTPGLRIDSAINEEVERAYLPNG